MRQPAQELHVFKERRAKLKGLAANSAVVIFAHPVYQRNDDVTHPYRADSNMFYLTGWEEPESALIIRPGQTPESILFVRPKDAARETWDGFRYGPEGAKVEYGVDEALPMAEFDARAAVLLKTCDKVFYRFGVDAKDDLRLIAILDKVRAAHGRSGRGLMPIHDSKELIGELRAIKSVDDIRYMRDACGVTVRGHIKAMQFTKPGVTERQVMATVLHSFYLDGAAREGYSAIVAAGNNATTLHYTFNDQPCRDGDLLLVDAGAETINCYTGDVTRTYPINGKFTEPQKQVYEAVLRVQKSLLAMAKPGVEFKSLMEYCSEALTDEMIGLGILKGQRDDLIKSLAFRKYYPHGMGHFLGIDVHDSGLHMINGKPRVLEPGLAFTVEPGLYIPANDREAPAQFRGIGVRIEDNVVITPTGHENLTIGAPKEVADLEAVVGRTA